MTLEHLRGDVSLEEVEALEQILAFHQFTFSQVRVFINKKYRPLTFFFSVISGVTNGKVSDALLS